jgi:TIR domain
VPCATIHLNGCGELVMSGNNELSQDFQPHWQAVAALNASPSMEPIHIHICYADEDEGIKNSLRLFLDALDKNSIKLWDRNDVQAGGITADAITNSLAQSKVILVLVSRDLNLEGEYRQAIDRYSSGDTELLPILVRPFVLPRELEGLRLLPKDRNPLSLLKESEQEDALLKITGEVKVICEGIQNSNLWDRQIEADIRGGRLNHLAELAIAEHLSGNSSKLFPEEQ